MRIKYEHRRAFPLDSEIGFIFKGEELCDRHLQPPGYSLERFKRGRAAPSFDKAQEVHRYAKHLSEAFLRQAAMYSNFSQAQTEFLSQRRHLEGLSKRQSLVVWLRAPPNRITGPFDA